MKIASSIFSDEFIAFTLNKETKYGYAPAAGLVGGADECILTECDPEEPARSNCERRCFASPEMCECRCPDMCYDNFCDCGSPEIAEGDYQQYLSIPTAYNFGDPKRVCPTPESPFMTMEDGSTGPPPDCNCQKCPETGKPNPDPNANASECCKDSLESEGLCTCLSDGGCNFVVVEDGRRVLKFRPKGDNFPWVWEPDSAKTGCYKCACPEGLTPSGTPEGEPKKFWRCPQDGEEGCQETTEAKGSYGTPVECQQKLQSGECEKKFVGLWNGDGYTCRRKPENWSVFGGSITEFDKIEDCNEAVAANNNCSCGALRPGLSSSYTALGHCTHKWLCDASKVFLPGDPWTCSKYPFFLDSTLEVYDSESICRQNCCNARYGDSFGRCSYDLDTVIPGWGCVVESKSDCLKRPGGSFSCGDCDLIPEGRECVGGRPTCGNGKKIAYEIYPTGLFTSELRCRCVDGPAQNEPAPDTGDGGETPPSGDGGDGGETPPSGDGGDGGETPPSGDGGETPPSGDGGETPPSGDGGETPPSGDGGETPPSGDGGETPPSGDGGDGGETPPSGDGGETPPSGDGGGEPPTEPEPPSGGCDNCTAYNQGCCPKGNTWPNADSPALANETCVQCNPPPSGRPNTVLIAGASCSCDPCNCDRSIGELYQECIDWCIQNKTPAS